MMCISEKHEDVRQAVLSRPEWNDWGVRSDESSKDYETRVRSTFTFTMEDGPEQQRMPDLYAGGRSTGAMQDWMQTLCMIISLHLPVLWQKTAVE